MVPENIQKEIDSISRQIVEKYKPQKIILFGSAASGKFKPDSDLDFLIVKDNVPYLGRDRNRELNKLIERNTPADFLIYKSSEFEKYFNLGDPFLKAIVRDGRIIYEQRS
ncbi:MAG: nucleotidyltransferase domain-containing protein [Candidatus Margulisiibacteriota bacterium]